MKSAVSVLVALIFYSCLFIGSRSYSTEAPHRKSIRKDVAALRGATIVVPCIPDSKKDELMLDLATEYHWTDDKGADLVDPRFTKSDLGNLEIMELRVSDSGVYKCKVIPQASSAFEQPNTRVFVHKITVYELAGHKYSSRLAFVLTPKQSVKMMKVELGDLLMHPVCKERKLCEPMEIQLERCHLISGIGRHKCVFGLSFKALPRSYDENCSEECLRRAMMNDLDQAYEILERHFLDFSRDPNSPIKPDLSTFSTHHLITCNPGFHLLKSHLKRCFPCTPGTYSGANSANCTLCDVGSYQEQYGKRNCVNCPHGKTTDSVGAISSDECIEEAKTILESIKSGFASLFGK